MPLITETYYLSLTQDNRGILRLRCSQDDTLRTVNLKLYNNGSIFVIPSGVSASISGVKQNGAVFSKSCTISQDRKSVVLQLSSDITNVDGIIVAEIVLNDGNGDRLGTSNFIIQVEKNPIRAGVIQDTETPIEYVNDFITQIQALTARVNNLITPNGDPSLAEVVDARISSLDNNIYQNLKARIDADIAALNTSKANKSEVYTKAQVDTLLDNVEIDVDGEFSDESENPVQNKVVASAISEINESLDDVRGDLGDKVGVFSKTEGYYINLTTDPVSLTPQTTTTAGMAFSIIECVSGDKFVINAVGGNTGRAWGFIDSSNHVLSMADANATVEGLTLTAPIDAVKLIINDKSGGVSYKVGNNLVSRVTALESVEPGLSQNAKTALINLVSHIGMWTDENGQRYIDTFVAALNGEQTVKVFIGKGISGSAIVDNPKRALTAPIPFINTAPITVRRTNSDDGYRYAIKFCVDDETVSSVKAGTAFAPGDKETPEGLQIGWVYSSNEQTLKEVVTTNPLVFGEPTVFEDTTNSTIRIIFAAYDSLSDDLPQNAPLGNIIIQGIAYKLEVGNNEDFV